MSYPHPYALPKQRWPKRAGVYAITDPVTNEQYIGATQRLNTRRSQHGSVLRCGNGGSKALRDAFERNKGNLRCSVILICEPNELQRYEQECIRIYKPALNSSMVKLFPNWRLASERKGGRPKKQLDKPNDQRVDSLP